MEKIEITVAEYMEILKSESKVLGRRLDSEMITVGDLLFRDVRDRYGNKFLRCTMNWADRDGETEGRQDVMHYRYYKLV